MQSGCRCRLPARARVLLLELEPPVSSRRRIPTLSFVVDGVQIRVVFSCAVGPRALATFVCLFVCWNSLELHRLANVRFMCTKGAALAPVSPQGNCGKHLLVIT